MGRPSPEHRSRSTPGKSPVRESRTPGSVGEVPGNWRLYPTIHPRCADLIVKPAMLVPMSGVCGHGDGVGGGGQGAHRMYP
jgi:hypothetical protein